MFIGIWQIYRPLELWKVNFEQSLGQFFLEPCIEPSALGCLGETWWMHPKYAASFRTSVRCSGTIDVNTADSTRTARLLERWRAPPRYSILTMTNKMARVSNWSPEYITFGSWSATFPLSAPFAPLCHARNFCSHMVCYLWFCTKIGLHSFTNVIGQQKCM